MPQALSDQHHQSSLQSTSRYHVGNGNANSAATAAASSATAGTSSSHQQQQRASVGTPSASAHTLNFPPSRSERVGSVIGAGASTASYGYGYGYGAPTSTSADHRGPFGGGSIVPGASYSYAVAPPMPSSIDDFVDGELKKWFRDFIDEVKKLRKQKKKQQMQQLQMNASATASSATPSHAHASALAPYYDVSIPLASGRHGGAPPSPSTTGTATGSAVTSASTSPQHPSASSSAHAVVPPLQGLPHFLRNANARGGQRGGGGGRGGGMLGVVDDHEDLLEATARNGGIGGVSPPPQLNVNSAESSPDGSPSAANKAGGRGGGRGGSDPLPPPTICVLGPGAAAGSSSVDGVDIPRLDSGQDLIQLIPNEVTAGNARGRAAVGGGGGGHQRKPQQQQHAEVPSPVGSPTGFITVSAPTPLASARGAANGNRNEFPTNTNGGGAAALLAPVGGPDVMATTNSLFDATTASQYLGNTFASAAMGMGGMGMAGGLTPSAHNNGNGGLGAPICINATATSFASYSATHFNSHEPGGMGAGMGIGLGTGDDSAARASADNASTMGLVGDGSSGSVAFSALVPAIKVGGAPPPATSSPPQGLLGGAVAGQSSGGSARRTVSFLEGSQNNVSSSAAAPPPPLSTVAPIAVNSPQQSPTATASIALGGGNGNGNGSPTAAAAAALSAPTPRIASRSGRESAGLETKLGSAIREMSRREIENSLEQAVRLIFNLIKASAKANGGGASALASGMGGGVGGGAAYDGSSRRTSLGLGGRKESAAVLPSSAFGGGGVGVGGNRPKHSSLMSTSAASLADQHHHHTSGLGGGGGGASESSGGVGMVPISSAMSPTQRATGGRQHRNSLTSRPLLVIGEGGGRASPRGGVGATHSSQHSSSLHGALASQTSSTFGGGGSSGVNVAGAAVVSSMEQSENHINTNTNTAHNPLQASHSQSRDLAASSSHSNSGAANTNVNGGSAPQHMSTVDFHAFVDDDFADFEDERAKARARRATEAAAALQQQQARLAQMRAMAAAADNSDDDENDDRNNNHNNRNNHYSDDDDDCSESTASSNDRRVTHARATARLVVTDSMDVDDLMGSASLDEAAIGNFIEHTKFKRERDRETGNTIINDFVVLGNLGQGAYGKVKLAHARDDKTKLVAIKIINKSLTKKSGAAALRQGATSESQIRREIAIMKKLRHKNIVSLHSVVDDPEAEKMYMVMDYIGGGTVLKDETDPKKKAEGFLYVPVPEETAVGYLRQLIDGLRHMHKHDIAHRDIKPANILLNNNRVYLSDFGVSELCDPEDTPMPAIQPTRAPSFVSFSAMRSQNNNGNTPNSANSRQASSVGIGGASANTAPPGSFPASENSGSHNANSHLGATPNASFGGGGGGASPSTPLRLNATAPRADDDTNPFAGFAATPIGYRGPGGEGSDRERSGSAATPTSPMRVKGHKGTPLFWPPEMFSSDPESEGFHDGEMQDLWALGVTLFMMLTGKAPFKATGFHELKKEVTSAKPVDIPTDAMSLKAAFLLRSMLSKDPRERPSLLDIRHHPFMGGYDKRSAVDRGSVFVYAGDLDEEDAITVTSGAVLPTHYLIAKVKPLVMRKIYRIRERRRLQVEAAAAIAAEAAAVVAASAAAVGDGGGAEQQQQQHQTDEEYLRPERYVSLSAGVDSDEAPNSGVGQNIAVPTITAAAGSAAMGVVGGASSVTASTSSSARGGGYGLHSPHSLTSPLMATAAGVAVAASGSSANGSATSTNAFSGDFAGRAANGSDLGTSSAAGSGTALSALVGAGGSGTNNINGSHHPLGGFYPVPITEGRAHTSGIGSTSTNAPPPPSAALLRTQITSVGTAAPLSPSPATSATSSAGPATPAPASVSLATTATPAATATSTATVAAAQRLASPRAIVGGGGGGPMRGASYYTLARPTNPSGGAGGSSSSGSQSQSAAYAAPRVVKGEAAEVSSKAAAREGEEADSTPLGTALTTTTTTTKNGAKLPTLNDIDVFVTQNVAHNSDDSRRGSLQSGEVGAGATSSAITTPTAAATRRAFNSAGTGVSIGGGATALAPRAPASPSSGHSTNPRRMSSSLATSRSESLSGTLNASGNNPMGASASGTGGGVPTTIVPPAFGASPTAPMAAFGDVQSGAGDSPTAHIAGAMRPQRRTQSQTLSQPRNSSSQEGATLPAAAEGGEGGGGLPVAGGGGGGAYDSSRLGAANPYAAGSRIGFWRAGSSLAAARSAAAATSALAQQQQQQHGQQGVAVGSPTSSVSGLAPFSVAAEQSPSEPQRAQSPFGRPTAVVATAYQQHNTEGHSSSAASPLPLRPPTPTQRGSLSTSSDRLGHSHQQQQQQAPAAVVGIGGGLGARLPTPTLSEQQQSSPLGGLFGAAGAPSSSASGGSLFAPRNPIGAGRLGGVNSNFLSAPAGGGAYGSFTMGARGVGGAVGGGAASNAPSSLAAGNRLYGASSDGSSGVGGGGAALPRVGNVLHTHNFTSSTSHTGGPSLSVSPLRATVGRGGGGASHFVASSTPSPMPFGGGGGSNAPRAQSTLPTLRTFGGVGSNFGSSLDASPSASAAGAGASPLGSLPQPTPMRASRTPSNTANSPQSPQAANGVGAIGGRPGSGSGSGLLAKGGGAHPQGAVGSSPISPSSRMRNRLTNALLSNAEE